MRQTWRHVTFLHWRCNPSSLRALIPRELELDTFDGEYWVGLVPFLITDLSPAKRPVFPWISTFPETNVRTYVVDRNGNRGVWFFSLDAARLLAVIGARVAYGLPYFWAAMSVTATDVSAHYKSNRLPGRNARTDIEIAIGEPIPNPDALDLFLTARFRLCALRRGRLLKADIQHQPWPLQRATVLHLEQNLIQTAGAPLVHFARRVDVLVSAPERIN